MFKTVNQQKPLVLTWVSVYWFSRAGPAASIRIYYETVQAGDRSVTLTVRNAPGGVSYFPLDIRQVPARSVLFI
jgi:hypothetical protein